MTGLPILEISGLNKSYGAVRAVDDVSLHVNRGEICGSSSERIGQVDPFSTARPASPGRMPVR